MGAFVIRRTACGHGVRTGKISVSVVSFFCVYVCVAKRRLYALRVLQGSASLSR